MADVISTTTPTAKTLYFAYGSNLSFKQMQERCPESDYIGVAWLGEWQWIINTRGYANIVNCPATNGVDAPAQIGVWGMVFALSVTDEARLDINEGVPWAYQKIYLEVDLYRDAEVAEGSTGLGKKEKITLLVYVDENHEEVGEPRFEYVGRMRRAIADALRSGVPRQYVDEVMRPMLPPETEFRPESD